MGPEPNQCRRSSSRAPTQLWPRSRKARAGGTTVHNIHHRTFPPPLCSALLLRCDDRLHLPATLNRPLGLYIIHLARYNMLTTFDALQSSF